jgi:sterol desaturase/sphingolipid hydroxylase (fatty acid hydroxylase superfamily)
MPMTQVPFEAVLRLAIFLGLLLILTVAEWRWPRQTAARMRRRRWPANLGLSLVDALTVWILFPWLALDGARYAQAHQLGLLQAFALPDWLRFALALVVLDCTIYWQHRLLHLIPPLWRLHRVHHTDLALDASSGVRFHPLEILLSLGIKTLVVVSLGAPPLAVLAFEIVLNGFALFTHANLALPERLDRALRWLVVTPDMHRIHHSIERAEHDRNFGFHLVWWDRLFRSYLDRPAAPQSTLPLGLTIFREDRAQRLGALLAQPFRDTGVNQSK